MKWPRSRRAGKSQDAAPEESIFPASVEQVQDPAIDELKADCFRCGKPAVGMTTIVMGKDGVPTEEVQALVCADCYAFLKENVRARQTPIR